MRTMPFVSRFPGTQAPLNICAHMSVDNIKNLSDQYNVLEGTMNLVQALYLNNKVKPFGQ